MRVIIVDDERFAIKYLEQLCMEIDNLEIVGRFINAESAMQFIESNPVDLILMDIEMPGISGLDAAHEIRALHPDMCIIFVTGYDQYALDAFRLDAVSYITKPCGKDDLLKAVRKAEKLLPPPPPKRRVEARTFGRFALMIDGEAHYFSNRKAKELLALLVDQCGAVVRMDFAISILWEDLPYDDSIKQRYRKAVSYLNQLMQEKNLDFFVSNRGSCKIIPEKIDCDYYRLMRHDPDAVRRYNGEYMLDYSWAESTAGTLQRFLDTQNAKG